MKPSGYVLDNLSQHMVRSSAGARTFRMRADRAGLGYPGVRSLRRSMAQFAGGRRRRRRMGGRQSAGGMRRGLARLPAQLCGASKYVARFIEHIDWDVVAAR